jgi:hypothetical protein
MCFAIFTANAATNYYQCWIASGGGVTCQNLEGGHYTVSWNTSTDWVAGKGWNPCNNANIQWTGGCSGCNYFGVYGWLSSPLVEYYIGRGGGSSAGSYSTSRGSYTLNSYNCNGPNITGNGAFIQFNCSGAGSSPINLGEHFNGWKGLGKQVNTQNYCMVASEAWSGSGNADVTVSEAGSSNTNPPTATATPSVTSAPTATPVPGTTNAPTAVPGGSSGCTCTAGCSSQTSISSNFTKDGAGEFCFVASSLGSYVNSWNLDSLKINGTDYTNKYAFVSSLPKNSDGKYYIYYKGSFAWSHFEAR